MGRYNAAGRSRSCLCQWLLFILSAAFLIQLAQGFSRSTQENKPVPRLGDQKALHKRARHFSDAGSHRILPRALDPTLVKNGGQLIASLNNRDYLPPSTFTDESAIENGNQGWVTIDLAPSSEVLSSIAPFLNANGLSSSTGDYKTQNTRNDQNAPGTPGNLLPTGAPMKNIFNIGQGTIIVEDILSPSAAPALNFAQFQTQVEQLGGVEVAQELGLPVPPKDVSGYAIPALSKWSDIVFLQLLRLGGNPDVKRVIQYHVTNPTTQSQIREALSTVGKGLEDVDISNGGSAVDFPADGDAAKALFKTPNGNGGYFLFAQHPDQLGSKTLDKISVFTTPRSASDEAPVFGEDTSAWYYMSAEFKDAPLPPSKRN